jgi:hypothetical protein
MTDDDIFISDTDKHFSCYLGLSARKPYLILYQHTSQQKRARGGPKRGKLHKVLDFYLGQDNHVYARVIAIDTSADFCNYVQVGKIIETPTNYEARDA